MKTLLHALGAKLICLFVGISLPLSMSAQTWTSTTSPTTNDLNSIWAVNSSNVWAVGASGTIIKYDGTNWATQTSNTSTPLNGVWGANANNVWAVGNSGLILKYNGSTWSAQTSNTNVTLVAIWGADANNLWAVGNTGTICSTTDGGTNWSVTTSGINIFLAVWGANSSNVWAAGNAGTIVKYNGSSWSAQNSGSTTAQIRGIWGTDANNLWAVANSGRVFSTTDGGANWTSQSLGGQAFRSITGTNASNIWAVGGSSVIYKYNGTTWSSQTSPVSGLTLNGIANFGTQEWIAGSTGNILTSSTIVPIELLRFEAQTTERYRTQLTWSTGSEINSHSFDIERSHDGVTFTKIGNVKAQGKAATYTFTDDQTTVRIQTSPSLLTYYRLKSIDNDQTFEYSKVVSVQVGGKTSKIKVYPTTTEGVITIENNESTNSQVSVFNTMGQLVYANPATNRIDLSILPQGLYFIQVQVGNEKVVKKVCKQ